jgi:signal transduction histidine kinase/DNA-binding NarL/FixJ family response regulator/HPt (histidine-containing phosphotransfer) domain-containing protein
VKQDGPTAHRTAGTAAATIAGLAVDAEAVRQLQFKAYIRNLPGLILGNLAGTGLVVWVFLPHVEAGILAGWVLAMVGLMAVQTERLLRWRQDELSFTADGLFRLLLAGAFLTGALWGLVPWILSVPGNMELSIFAIFTLAVLNTGGAVTLAPCYPAYVASLLPCLPSAIARAFALESDLGTASGVGLILLTLFLLGMSRVIAGAFTEAFRMQLNQEALLRRMQDQAELLRQSAEAAQQANRAKSEFLATISHEIRTPVNAILGGIDILSTTGLDGMQRQCVGVVGKAGQSLLGLLDDLLDIGRIEAGRMTLDIVTFELHRRLRDIIDLMTPRAVEKGLQLRLDLSDQLPGFVRGDPTRIRQILLNLIGNAIKFSDRGVVQVTATARRGEGSADGPVLVQIAVSDSGIGIPADRLEGIFQPFSQADGSITRRFGGSGLGLAISRHLVQMMGGQIGVDSRAGLGSRFYFELPLLPVIAPADPERPAPLPRWTGGLTVLLVEDEAVNRFVATQLLERQSVQVQQAHGGAQALERLRQGPLPDAILMDIGMPGMDGFETTRRIKAMEGPAAAIPVIALTANVVAETVERCRTIGMADFVSKPVRLPKLMQALARSCPDRLETPGTPEAGTAEKTIQTATVPSAEPAAAGEWNDNLLRLRADLGVPAAEALLAQARSSLTIGRQTLSGLIESDPPDFGQISNTVHRLAGTLEIIGAVKAVLPARQLEMLPDPAEPADQKRLLTDLITALDRLLLQWPPSVEALPGTSTV